MRRPDTVYMDTSLTVDIAYARQLTVAPGAPPTPVTLIISNSGNIASPPLALPAFPSGFVIQAGTVDESSLSWASSFNAAQHPSGCYSYE